MNLITAITTCAFLLSTLPFQTSGHGYAKSPRSRNWLASDKEEGVGSGTSTQPLFEDCPHCLNKGGPYGPVCGITDGYDYRFPKNAAGGFLGPKIQATYAEGDVIEIETVLTSHHQGHQVLKACPDFFNPTQECFDNHVLEFVEDPLYHAPKDVNYPERGYFHPNNGDANPPGNYIVPTSWGMGFLMKFKLPDGLYGEPPNNYVLLQWHYVTGNSCRHPGYDVYPWPQGWEPDNMGPCPDPLPQDGSIVPPEQFWNCIEVAVVQKSPTISPKPTISSAPTKKPTTTSAPVPSPPGCCSQNYKDCVTWCGSTESECNNCSDNAWLPNGAPTNNCAQRYNQCQSNSDCCFPAICKEVNPNYSQCLYDPNATPAPSAMVVCEDDESWRDATSSSQGCSWVGADYSSRCMTEGNDGRKAYEACPKSCNLCSPSPPNPTPTPPIPPTPPTGNGQGCCTIDFKNCSPTVQGWCSESQSNCEGPCDKWWLSGGAITGCNARFESCNADSDCCSPGVCVSGQCGEGTGSPPTPPTPTPPTPPTPTPPTPPTPTSPSPTPPTPTPPSPTPPTPTPPSPPTPTPPTPTSDYCCTWDFYNCGVLESCNENSSNCHGTCGGTWMQKSSPAMTCLSKFQTCTGNTDKCCGNLSCEGDASYKQCVDVSALTDAS